MSLHKILMPLFLLVLLWLGSGSDALAQKAALRTNLLYDATLSPNLGAEVRVDSTWSVGILGGVNFWDINKTKNKKWRHVLVNPSVRHYFGHRRDSLRAYETVTDENGQQHVWVVLDSAVTRRVQYWEAGILYSHFNAGNVKFPFGLYQSVRDHRLQGDLIALSGKYGWAWRLSSHWRMEADLGLAVGYAWFKEYDCSHCGRYYGKSERLFLMPQIGANLVYLIK